MVGGRGVSGDPFKSIECYDLRSDRWFRVTEMSTKRRHVGVIAIKGKLTTKICLGLNVRV